MNTFDTMKLVDIQDVNPIWEDLTPNEKRQVFDTIEILENWCDTVKKLVKDDLRSGVPVTGLSLDNGKRSQKIIDVDKARTICNTHFGVTNEQFLSCCSASIPQLEKVVCANNSGIDKTTMKGMLRERLMEVSKITTSAPSIVCTK